MKTYNSLTPPIHSLADKILKFITGNLIFEYRVVFLCEQTRLAPIAQNIHVQNSWFQLLRRVPV